MYTPIFVGRTKDDEKIVVYKRRTIDSLHIQLPNGELWALEPGAEVTKHTNVGDDFHIISIHSNVWSGEARGTRSELIEEPNLKLVPVKGDENVSREGSEESSGV